MAATIADGQEQYDQLQLLLEAGRGWNDAGLCFFCLETNGAYTCRPCPAEQSGIAFHHSSAMHYAVHTAQTSPVLAEALAGSGAGG